MVTIVYTDTQKVHRCVVANWQLVTEEEVHCYQLLLYQTWTPKHMFCLLVCKQADALAKCVHGRTGEKVGDVIFRGYDFCFLRVGSSFTPFKMGVT